MMAVLSVADRGLWWLHHRPRRVHQLSAVAGLLDASKLGREPGSQVPRPSFDGVVSGLVAFAAAAAIIPGPRGGGPALA